MSENGMLPSGREDLLQIEGIVEHIVYQNEQNGYTVCSLAVSEDELVTLVGIMPFLAAGESIKALGKWELHSSFGRQFKIEYYEKHLPSSQSSMVKYLSSGAIKGIGPKLARRIVEKFGEDTFEIIEHHPEWLSDINGISPKAAKKMSESFKQAFGVRSVMMFCSEFFGPTTAVRIYKQWGGASLDMIKKNPYALCEKIHGIGFETADKIAEKLGVGKDSAERIRAGAVYFLSYNAIQNGHTFVPSDKLYSAVSKFLDCSEEAAIGAISSLIGDGRLISAVYEGREVIYLKEYLEAERYIAAKLIQLSELCEKISSTDTDRFISQLEAEIGITYATLQRKAIISSLNSGVTILTGGPGTGKTTVIRAVITVFERMGLKIVLAAPTGRAAKRMSEATGCEAKTIHRLLEMDYSLEDKPNFRRNENDMLDQDVIIIDEASMVDTLLASSLLKAIKPGARVIFIGDSDQLPSVGAGNVLNDMIESECFDSVRLKQIFRQAGDSYIVINAHAINNGEYPELSVKNGDFFFLQREEGAISQTICELISKRLPRRFGEEAAKGIQVITPSHKGVAGTDNLNALIQQAINPPSPDKNEKKLRETVFREGDKVMQIRNNYDLVWEKDGYEGVGIFNGDIGKICEISPSAESVTVDFDGRIAVYDFTQLDELEHAYAITVHKSQGSEYPTVIIPAYAYSPRLLTRNLLYTAVTRAKDMVIVVGSARVIQNMVDNNRQVERYTGLIYLLRAYLED